MKTLITGCALIVCMHIKAQTILPTSSAQECITFIQSTLKAAIAPQPSYKDDIFFNGTQIAVDHIYASGSVYRDLYQNIDWSKYKKMSWAPSGGNTVISFDFTQPFRRTDQTYYNGNLEDIKITQEDYFILTINQSDTVKIKGLETAATRLAEIAREKSSPLLTVKAPKIPSEGKPTYKETASFIKSYFNTDARKKHNFIATYWYEAGYLNSISYRILYVEIADCILYVGYETLRTNYITKAETKKVVNFQIDASKIEQLTVQVTGTRDRELKEQHFVNHIAFKVLDNPSTFLLPFDGLAVDAPNNGTQTQIFKAFTQLKKLCGAPEPVVFD
jgi:hypothetical protein